MKLVVVKLLALQGYFLREGHKEFQTTTRTLVALQIQVAVNSEKLAHLDHVAAELKGEVKEFNRAAAEMRNHGLKFRRTGE